MARFIVVDLEATCWEKEKLAKNEIIEFGAVAYDSERGSMGEFQAFVKPVLQPILSYFCTHEHNSRIELYNSVL